MRRLAFLVVAMLLSVNFANAQNLIARVNRDQIPEGETFLLTLELQNSKNNESPNFSALDKDFTVYSVSNAYRSNIVNGQMSQSRQWNLVMMPKSAGKLVIPAISVDNFSSQPVEVMVTKAGETLNPVNPQQANQPRFAINGSVDNKKPFVQEQINYTLTLVDSGGLQGEEPSFMMDSTNNDWIIKNLGDPSVKTKVVDGKNFREIKFNYAMFPQKSGKLTVPEVKFNGFYLTRDSRRADPFGSMFGDDMMMAGFGMMDVFATRNPVILVAKPFEIEVQPVPANNNSKWWLPATSVELYGQFEPQKPTFKVGEAVNRTIYLKATGVINTQLPEIKFASSEGLKQYPEKPQTEMKVENGQVISLEKIANVYIPNAAGEMTIPAIEIDWFNVKTNSLEKATLPATKIKVMAADGVTHTTAPTENEPVQPQLSEQIEMAKSVNLVYVYIALLAAFGLGIVVSYMLMKRDNKSPSKEQKISNYKKYIISLAQSKDLRSLRDALVVGTGKQYKTAKVSSLQDVQALIADSNFSAELDKLNATLYAKSEVIWNSDDFIKAFTKIYAKKDRKKDEQQLLPELYK